MEVPAVFSRELDKDRLWTASVISGGCEVKEAVAPQAGNKPFSYLEIKSLAIVARNPE